MSKLAHKRPDLNNLKAIFEFTVLWKGWECDSTGWVCEQPDGTRVLVLTNHGGKYLADAKELQAKLEEYDLVVSETKQALKLLEP